MCRCLAQNQAAYTGPTTVDTGHSGAPWSCAVGQPLAYTMSLFTSAKGTAWVPAQLAGPRGTLAGFQRPLAPFVRAQTTALYTGPSEHAPVLSLGHTHAGLPHCH